MEGADENAAYSPVQLLELEAMSKKLSRLSAAHLPGVMKAAARHSEEEKRRSLGESLNRIANDDDEPRLPYNNLKGFRMPPPHR